MFYAPLASSDVERLIAQAQCGDEGATTALLEGFRPLLRSRMHALWSAIQSGFTSLEWEDVESQVTFLFLSRLRTFRPGAGVYFPHYIERMLDLDARYWLRCQRRGAATPFSQLPGFESDEGDDEGAEWALERAGSSRILGEVGAEETQSIERNLALRAALDALPKIQREVVWNCCVLGRTEAGLALELGVSRSAVRNRLEAAIKTMRLFFSEAGALPIRAESSEFAPTRTGRASKSRVLSARQQFFEGLFAMAKDETRPDLVGVGAGRPVLLQGTFDFPATGLKTPELLAKKLTYTVPAGHVLGVRYLRIGAVSGGMIAVSTVINGLTHRIVPCAANATTHVSFAIVDPHVAGSQLEIHIASQCEGTAIIDVGCLQMPA